MLSSYFRRLEAPLSSGLAFDTMRMQGHLFVEIARALWSREAVHLNSTHRREP